MPWMGCLRFETGAGDRVWTGLAGVMEMTASRPSSGNAESRHGICDVWPPMGGGDVRHPPNVGADDLSILRAYR